MSFLLRRALAAVLSFSLAFGPTAQAVAAGNDSYFRYRIDGVDASGMTVMVRGPETPVLSGSPISIRTRVIGGQSPYVFALDTGTLPPGLSVAAQNGDIDGVATEAGNYDFTVRATDVNGLSNASQPFRVSVQYKRLEVTRTPSLSAKKGQAYSDRLAASGGKEPYSWSVAEGALPAGISLDAASGALAGTPTSLGQFPFRARVSDAAGASALTGQLVLFVDAAALSIAGSAPTSGNVGQLYTGRYEAAGGAPPYTYVLPAGALPPGVTLDGGTGWVRGTPTTAGLYPNIRVRAVDSTRRYADSTAFSVNVFADLAASWDGQSAVRDVAYSGKVKAYGGRTPYSYLLTAGELPQGLSLDTASGTISGTPTVGVDAAGLDVRVTDAQGRMVQTGPFSISVSNKLTIVSAPSRGAVLNQSYSSGFATGGGTRPYSYALRAGTLPQGLGLSGSTGVISGAPGTLGTTSGLQVQVTDAVGDTALSPVFSIDVRRPVMVSIKNLPSIGTVGQAFSGSAEISGGLSPYVTAFNGSLPSGLVFDASSAAVSGTPVSAGTFGGLSIQAQDADGRTGVSATFSIVVSQPLIVGAPAVTATVGMPYASAASISGGRQPYAVTASPSLPAGLSLDPASGSIGGTPAAAGTIRSFQITVRDQDGRVATTIARDFVVTAPLVATAPDGTGLTTGKPYQGSFTASGGRAPYTFASSQGALPTGIAFDAASGRLSGTPTVPGTFRFSVAVTDASGGRVDAETTLQVSSPLVVASSPATDATVGASYASSAGATGGRGPLAWSIGSSTLPAGLTLDAASGRIEGRPSFEGTSNGIVLHAVDADGRAADGAAFSIDVRQPVVVTGSPDANATAGIPYSGAFSATGGRAPFSWSIASGRLPGGLTLEAASGSITGTPTQGGDFSYAVKVVDAAGRTATSERSIAVASSFTIVDAAPLSDATVGQSLTHTFQVSGGAAPFTFSVSQGVLPTGLSLSSSGTIAGTPTTAGKSTGIVVSARDASGVVSSTSPFDIDARDPLAVSGNPPTGGTFSRAYSARFAIAGGRAPFTMSSTGQALPPGLSFSTAWDARLQVWYGLLSGTASAVGTYPALVGTIQDAAGRTADTAPFEIQIIEAFAVSANLPTEATLGTSYDGAVTAADGERPFSYAVSEGRLPTGLSLDATSGSIGGTPSETGTFTGIVLSATDARGRTVSTDPLAVTVRNALTYALRNDAFAIVGESWTAQAVVTGGRAPFNVSVLGGSVAPGLSFDNTGTLSGTPTGSGRYVATLRLRDADGRSAPDLVLDRTVAARLSIGGSVPAAVTRGRGVTGTFTASGGRVPYTYAVTAGALPHGIALDASGGTVDGTPDRIETQSGIVIAATDADGRRAATAPFGIAVSDDPSFSATPGGYPTVGTAWTASSAVVGGTAPYVFSVGNGTLPDGLTLDASTGTVSGTATSAGARTFVMVVTDTAGSTGQATTTIDVRAPIGSSGTFTQAATTGEDYGSSITIAGGRAPFAVQVASGSIPSGLGLWGATNSASLSGKPAGAGSSSFTLSISDADGRTAAAGPFTIDVRDPVAVSGTAPAATAGRSYSANYAASGGRAPYRWSITTGSAPAGLGLDAANGTLAGTPSAAGTYSFVVAATDADGRRATLGQTVSIREAIHAVAGAQASYGTIGEAFSRTTTFAGGTTPYVFALGAGALPAGLNLDTATGAIAGTPSAVGTTAGLRVDATDAQGDVAQGVPFSFDVRQPVVIQAPDKVLVSIQTDGSWGSLSASGGAGGYVFSVVQGVLPIGLTLDATSGSISGRVASEASNTVVFRVQDAQGRSVLSQSVVVEASSAIVATFADPAQTLVGRAFSANPVSVAGGRPPYAWTILSGTLPAGMTFDGTTGRIAGTPASAVSTSLAIRVADAGGRYVDGSYLLSVRNPLVASYPNSGRGGFTIGTGSTYAPTLAAGCTPIASSIYAGGNPPDGLAFTNDGAFSYGGGAVSAGSYNFVVRTQDACGSAVDNSVTLNVATAPPQAAAPSSLKVVRGASSTLPPPTITGGTGPFAYETVSTLPEGLSLDPATGAISGAVQAAMGSVLGPISILVTDSYGRQAQTPSFSLTVVDPLTIAFPSTKLPFAVGTSTSYAPVVAGGCGNLSWTASGSRPSTLSFSTSSGSLSNGGLASGDVGTYPSQTITATDSCGIVASSVVDLDVQAGAPTATMPANRQFVIGQQGTTGPVATSNLLSPTYDLVQGPLPNYLALDPVTGAVSGTVPTGTSGTFATITVRATDAYGRTASTPRFPLVAVSQLGITYANGGNLGWQTGSITSASPTVTGGCSISSYVVDGTPLASGVSLNTSNGTLTGTLNAQGTYGPYSIKATDTCGQTSATNVTIDVRSGSVAISLPTVREVAVGRQNTLPRPVATGFNTPTFVLASGSLPTYLSLDPVTGRISGDVPANTALGTIATIAIRAADAYGRTATTGTYAITAAGQPSISYPNSGRVAWRADIYSTIPATKTGGCSVNTYASTGTALPSQMILDPSTGGIYTTLTAAGTYGPYTLQMTDVCGQTASANLLVDVRASGPSITNPTQRSIVVGTASYTSAYSWANYAPDAVATVNGTLPPGFAVDGSNRFAGTLPSSTSAGTTYGPFTVTVTDSFGRNATAASFSLTAAAAPAVTYVSSYPVTGTAFTLDPTISGGVPAYVYTLSGTLPSGLTFSSSTGRISGTPTATGDFPGLSVSVTDQAGATFVSNQFALSVVAPLAVSGTPTQATVGTSYTFGFAATGGTSPYVFSSTGTLPPGLTLSSAGVLSGTPSTTGTYAFTVNVADAQSRAAQLGISLNVVEGSTAGTYYGWGTTLYARGTAETSYTPIQATSLPALSQIAVGTNSVCGIKSDGTAVCWGQNAAGQLGNGSTATNLTPQAVSGGRKYTSIAAADLGYCAIDENAALWCWGSNANGAVGNNSSTMQPTPAKIGSATWLSVASGSNTMVCGIQSDKSLWCWGKANTAVAGSSVPTKVASGTSWSKIAVGSGNLCGIQAAGSLWCWGVGTYGVLGNGANTSGTTTPQRIGSLTNWSDVTVDVATGCALDTNGQISCWGLNNYGSTGDNSTRNAIRSPGPVVGGYTFKALRNGYNADVCGITLDGSLYCWGYNVYGALGDGTTTHRYVPTPVTGPIAKYRDVTIGPTQAYGLAGN